MTSKEYAPPIVEESEVAGGNIDPGDLPSEASAELAEAANPKDDELVEDQENRHESREILGLSVRTKLYVREKAADAVSNSDSAWAKVRNAAGSPLRRVREFRKNRAESGLERRQNRLRNKHAGWMERYESRKSALQAKVDAKHDSEQAAIDAPSSSRLRQLRQERHAGKHEKRQAKVDAKLQKHLDRINDKRVRHQTKIDNYENGRLQTLRSKYEDSVAAKEGRLESAGTRSTERLQSIEQYRESIICSKELALARKALRHELRDSDSASRREARMVVDEVLKDTDPAVLRDLGRKFIDMQGAERSLSDSIKAEDRLGSSHRRAEALLDRARSEQAGLPDKITANETLQTDLVQHIEALQEQAAEAYRANGPDSVEYASAIKQEQQTKRQLERLQRKKSAMERTLQELPDSIARFQLRTQELQDQIEAQRHTTGDSRTQASQARSGYRAGIDSILGSSPKEEKPPSKPNRQED